MASLTALVPEPREGVTARRRTGASDATPAEMCLDCGATKTPLWRWDPAFEYGVRRLCNRCGCKAARLARKHYGEKRKAMREAQGLPVEGEWASEWGALSSSSSDPETEQEATQAPEEIPVTASGRPKRQRRASLVKEEAGVDAWVTIEAAIPTSARQKAILAGRKLRALAAQPPIRRQSQGNLKVSGKENSSSLRKRPRKQKSPSRGL